MGFFKKITRPISRVLDKIIPNEIKPALPYLAAAAPFFGPTSAMMGEGMLRRALISGGLNLGGQLAQEGNEGEVNPLSLALASGIGALSAPGTAGTKAMGVDKFGKTIYSGGTPSAGTYLKGLSNSGGIGDQALNFLGTGADKLQGLKAGLAADGIFSKAGAQALSIPITQGTMDLSYADQVRLNKQDIIDDALGGLSEGFSNEDASNAIRLSMLRYGFSEDEIVETITSAGYKAGGRVGFDSGGDVEVGIMSIKEAAENSPMSNESVPQMYVSDSAGVIPLADGDAVKGKTMDMMAMGAIEPYGKNDFRDEDGYERFIEIFTEFKNRSDQKNKELNSEGIKNGGIIGLNMGGSVLPSGGEMDYRQGGMIPMGSKERADDVPARLSKNEFVMTADAVRAAGGGSVNQGAKRMYNLMNNLEARA